jgi:hypothetical protein
VNPVLKSVPTESDPEYLEVDSFDKKSSLAPKEGIGIVDTVYFDEWVGVELERFLGDLS